MEECASTGSAGFRPETRPRPSQLLRELATTWPGERVSLRDIVEVLGDRAYSFLILAFALPNVIPNPIIGLSTILGAPLVLLTAQRVVGRVHLWLPRILSERSIATMDFRQLTIRIVPLLERLEGLATPRLHWIADRERLFAPFCLLLALVLALPIPFGNIIPALAISLTALGSIERDGLAIAAGIATGVAGLVVVWAVVGAVAAFLK